jgi:hypothetical protein
VFGEMEWVMKNGFWVNVYTSAMSVMTHGPSNQNASA